jgi:xylulokinase
LPYLSGERTPHNSASVRGSFHGLSHDTTAAHLAYAVIEGVTFGLHDGLRALQAAGCQVGRLSLVGGGSRSAMWAQQLASCLNIEIVTHGASAAGGALGAARLAWLAAGGDIQTVCTAPATDRVFSPNAPEQMMMAPRYQQFRNFYIA